MTDNISLAVLFLAQAMTAWLYSERVLAQRQKLPVIIAIFAAGYAALFGVTLLDITLLDFAAFFIVNVLVLCINYRCTLKISAMHAGFLTLAMSGAEVVFFLVVRLFGYEYGSFTYNFSLVIAPMSKLLYLMLAFIGARFFTPKETVEEPKMTALFLSISIISMLLSILFVYIGSYAGLTGTTETMISRNIFALLAVNLLVLMLCNYFLKANAERSAPEPSVSQAHDTGYYEALQEQYDNQRRLVHDIKNHLHAIEGLAVEGNATEVVSYISGLESGFAPSNPVRLSSDPVLNSILVRFRKDCDAKNVAFTYDLREGGAAFMAAPEVTTLYGNLLSNAIEAAEISAEKAVELSVVRNIAQEVLIISVNNSCDAPPVRDSSGRMLSRKRGSRTPGLGLKNIERVVRKYHGVETMYYDADSKQFHHIIQFPVTP